MAHVITPTLPHRYGYVEIDQNGNRLYKSLINSKIYSPDDNIPEIPNLYTENKLLKAQLQAQTDRSDFIEDCIAEMAGVVYSAE